LSTSLPGCLKLTCVQCENGKSISPIDSAQPTMAHEADTDSDLARQSALQRAVCEQSALQRRRQAYRAMSSPPRIGIRLPQCHATTRLKTRVGNGMTGGL
jgi:hypothetical protein